MEHCLSQVRRSGTEMLVISDSSCGINSPSFQGRGRQWSVRQGAKLSFTSLLFHVFHESIFSIPGKVWI